MTTALPDTAVAKRVFATRPEFCDSQAVEFVVAIVALIPRRAECAVCIPRGHDEPGGRTYIFGQKANPRGAGAAFEADRDAVRRLGFESPTLSERRRPRAPPFFVSAPCFANYVSCPSPIFSRQSAH